MTKPNQYTKATLVLIQILIGAAQSHGQGDIATTYETAAKIPCHEIVFLEKVIANAKTAATKATDQVQQRASEAALLGTASCSASDHAERLRYQALAALTNSKLAAAIGEASKAATILAATAILDARVAQTKLVVHRGVGKTAVALAVAAAAKTAQVGTSSSPKYCGFKFTTTPAAHTTCAEVTADEPKLQAAANYLKGLKGIMLLKEKTTDEIHIKGTTVKAGNFNTDDANFKGGICAENRHNLEAATSDALGVVDVELEPADTALEKHTLGGTDQPNQKCVDNTGEAYGTDKLALTRKTVGRAICDIRDNEVATIDSYLDKDIADLITDPEAQKVAELLLTGNVKKDCDTNHKKAAVKQLFGTDKGSLREKLINPLKEKHIKYKENDENSKKTVSEAAHDGDGHAALAACYGQCHRDSLKKQAAPTTTVSVEKCKADTDESK
ncbi:uncharacterized protein TEOVI_000548900 [Trypanosoma equiperdum]|uniref:Variant surface glycoprotein (VSG) n=1 Tax=Trypanosoma equiperdum TaxID=5694 RepID=A0A1G4I1A0_TRYEQ|nr:hypothetical protein, conserved [Trypanosoma equiperdum]